MFIKIIHFTDVHIRLNSGFKILKHVIANFLIKLKTYDSTTTLVVCTGDVFHSKTSLSPDAVLFARSLFEQIIELGFTVVIIPGNHDGNENNLNRNDAIQTLVPYFKDYQNKFRYFRESGVYEVGNITFGVGSVFSEKKKPPLASTIVNLSIPLFRKVALFHGIVRGAVYQNQQTDTTSECRLEDFNGYDLILLGDIHKHQFLAPNCAYASSLSQQNYGEDIEKHGFIEWDLNTNKGVFVRVPSSYAYVTLNITDGVVKEPDNLPQNLYVRVYHQNTSKEQLQIIQRKYSFKHNIIEWKEVKQSNFAAQRMRLSNFDDDIMNSNYLNELIKRNYEDTIDKDTLKDIYALNKTLNNKLSKSVTERREWDIKYIEFSNMFCFEKTNKIDFKSLSNGQIIEIFGSNGSGKSSLMDIISFSLFGKCSRGNAAKNIVRKGAKTYHVEVIFSVNGKLYRIERMGSKMNTKKPKTETYIFELVGDNQARPITLSTQKETNKLISDLVGNLETFELTQFMNTGQHRRSFLEETNACRKNILSTLLGMNRFKELVTLAKGERKSVDKELRQLQIALPALKADTDKMLELYKKQLINFESNKASVMKKLDDNEHEYKEIVGRVGDVTFNEDTLRKTLSGLNTKLSNIKSKMLKYKKELSTLDVNIPSKDEYNIAKKEYDIQKKAKKELNNELDKVLKNMQPLPQTWDHDICTEELQKCKIEFKDFNAADEIKIHEQKISSIMSEIGRLNKTYTHINYTFNTNMYVEKAISAAVHAANSAAESAITAILEIPFLSKDACVKVNKTVVSMEEQYKDCMKKKKFYDEELKDFAYDHNCSHCVRNNKLKIIQQRKLKILNTTILKYETNIATKKRIYKQLHEYNQYYGTRKKELITKIAKMKERYTAVNQCIQNSIIDKTLNSLNSELNHEMEQKNKKYEAKIRMQALSTKINTLEKQLLQYHANSTLQQQEIKLRARIANHTLDDIVIKKYENGIIVKARFNNLTKHIEQLEEQKVELNSRIKEINKQLENKNRLNDLTRRNQLEINIVSNKGYLKNLECKHVEIKTRFDILKAEKDTYDEASKNIHALTSKIQLLKQYETIMDHKKGIPNIIIADVLPIIMQQVNYLLLEIVDFQLVFKLIPHNQHIEVEMKHRDVLYSLATCSSSEKVISDIVTRTVLSKLVNKTHIGNIFIGDEIFAQFDIERKSQIPKVFDFLRRHFDISLIITHNDDIRQIANKRIQIMEKEPWSTLVY